MIIGICGARDAGKDLTACFIKQLDPSYEIVKFATGLRKCASILIDVPACNMMTFEEKATKISKNFTFTQLNDTIRNMIQFATNRTASDTELSWFISQLSIFFKHGEQIELNCTIGELLQILGTECFRNGINSHVWVDKLLSDYKDEHLIISDLRFPNEEEKIRELGGIVIRINRPNHNQREDGRSNIHESETMLDRLNPDFTFENDGSLQDLFNKMETFMHRNLSKYI
jgi:hypothetical protein